MLPPIARSMGKQARIRFRAPEITAITLDLIPRVSDLNSKPLGLEVLLNGVRLLSFEVCKHGWLEVAMPIPESLSAGSNGEFELEFRADRAERAATSDGREISIAVCNIEIRSREPGAGSQHIGAVS